MLMNQLLLVVLGLAALVGLIGISSIIDSKLNA